MEKQKTNKIKITINGQSFEVPMDMSVLQSFIQTMPQKMTRGALGLPTQQVAQQVAQQSSHRRLEDDFFGLIREDMDTFRRFNMFNRDERTSRAIVALHNRLRRIEEMCFAPEKPVAKKRVSKQVSKQVSEKAKPSSAKKPVKKSLKK